MSESESEDTAQQRADLLAARKRYNMKALGQLVDSNRLTGVQRPNSTSSGPHHRTDEIPPEPVESRRADPVEEPAAVPVDEAVDTPIEPVEVRHVEPVGEPTDHDDASVADSTPVVGVEDSDVFESTRLPDEIVDHGLDVLFDVGDPVEPESEVGPEELLEGTDRPGEPDIPDVPVAIEPDDSGVPASPASASVATEDGDDGNRADAVDDDGKDADQTLIELRDRGARARRRPERAGAVPAPESFLVDDGIDRSEMGTQVTRTGLGGLLEVTPHAERRDPRASGQPLARQMLDDEIQPGGRLSNPRDVPGIVLNLAKDIPAAAAVSVVRIDEEIELVGNTIDPDIEPGVLASMFSGLFRSIQVAAGALAQGPLGTVHDLVIEGEHMDLILRPLGVHYYLMVLEDRRSEQADLAATRMRMAALAPGLAAMLAQGDGEV